MSVGESESLGLQEPDLQPLPADVTVGEDLTDLLWPIRHLLCEQAAAELQEVVGQLVGEGLGVDELRQEAADLGEGGHEALVEGVVGGRISAATVPSAPGDRLSVLAQGAQHGGDGPLVVEGVKESLVSSTEFSNGIVGLQYRRHR